MKTKIIAAGAAALVLSLASPAWSQDAGFYLGASIGVADHGEICQGADTFCDKRDGTAKAFAGMQFGRHFALEAAYADLGKSRATGATDRRFETTAWELVGIGFMPLWHRLSLLGKLGVYRAETQLEGTAQAKESNADVTFGLGLQFGITRNLGVRADWQRYIDVGGDRTGETDINSLNLGVLYKF